MFANKIYLLTELLHPYRASLLVAIIGTGTIIFSTLHEFNSRLGKLEMLDKLDTIVSRLDAIDPKLDAIDPKLDAIDPKLDAIDSRFEAIDSGLGKLEATLEAKLEAIDSRLGKLEAKLDAKMGVWSSTFRNTASTLANDLPEKESEIDNSMGDKETCVRSGGKGCDTVKGIPAPHPNEIQENRE